MTNMAISCHAWLSRKFLIATLLSAFLTTQSVQAKIEDQENTCNDIDIRNSVKNFNRLSNCTVVEGFLRIVLIEKAQPQDYYNLSFPKLTEITGYLLLYRVSGIVSLADIFPNLAVIRGNDLFHNFAVVIFEMPHLQEIGLKSLTDVLRGSLFILKNPNLCYLQTVDWSLILRAGKEHSTIHMNKDPDQCPDTCPSYCPKNLHCQHSSNTFKTDTSCILCWNRRSCQKVCNEACSLQNQTCYNRKPYNNNPSDYNNPSDLKDCCHRECLGGCTGGNSSNCKVCHHVFYNNMCLKKCPEGTFEFKKRRCIIEQECISVNITKAGSDKKVYWKPFQGQCLNECPPEYTAYESEPHKCVPCRTKCPKICAGDSIDNVAHAQKFKGCTVVDGSLHIQVNGGANIIKELEDNLETITEIRGLLKISRAFPLVSLNFLKNLEVIKGENLELDRYALVVMENPNLQELWDWKNRKNLTIEKGKIFFHFNTKLCYEKIRDFYKRVYGENKELPDVTDVSNTTNGDRVACDVANLNITLKIDSKAAVVSWPSFTRKVVDQRSLLGYLVYFKEAPFQNVSIFDGRGACGTDTWKIIDVAAGSHKEDSTLKFDTHNQKVEENANATVPVIHSLIPHLEPFTQYALFVRTYTIASEKKGARSDIYYFKTLSYTPSQPTDVEAKSLQWSDITINWKPPKEPKGIITHYIVTVTEQKDSQDYMNQRDFCLDSRQRSTIKKVAPIDHPPIIVNSSETIDGECCACPKKNVKLEKEEEIANMIKNFEDFLQNNVYIKNPDSVVQVSTNRNITTRSVSGKVTNIRTTPITTPSTLATAEITYSTSSNLSNSVNITTTESPVDTQDNRTRKIIVSSKDIESNGQFTIVQTGLKHFTDYTIEIRACQDPSVNRTKPPPSCSLQAIVNVRTLPLGGADDILNESVVIKKDNSSDGSVFVKWDEPVSPNSLIVSYHLEYRSVDKSNIKVYPDCVTQSQYAESHGYLLRNILPGKYHLRIRATSLAGEGNWTTPLDFEIESPPEKAGYIFVSVLVVVLAIGSVVMVVGVYVYKKRLPNIPPGILYASVNPEYMSAGLVYEADEWEVPREKITLIRELGQGSFGMVYEGKAIDMFPGQPVLRCAVKTVNETASLREQIEFLQEASIMKAFKCHHVVKLLGVVSKGNPTLVIMELMAKGDLKSYLRSLRPEDVGPKVYPTLTLTEIYKMALQIADGMAYLGNKKYVHRDLAARNCMVDDNITVKIGDFGMTRDIYETDYYRKGGRGLLPVRWMAPESLKDGVFTFHSDVWSYGVVLWEMVTLASQPYQGLSNEQVLKYVILGKQMEEPENCPPLLFELMQKCWLRIPEGRPSFAKIIEKLLPEVSDIAEFREKSFFFNHESMDNDNGESATPATPLKSSFDANHISSRQSVGGRDVISDCGNVQYNNFPSGSTSVSEHRNNSTNALNERLSMAALNDFCTVCGRTCNGSCLSSNDDASLVEEGNGAIVVNLNNGSKGSKVSSVSNGSLANGHLHLPSGRTTTC